MAPSTLSHRLNAGTQRIRDHVLTSLHLGRLQPGDRVASVRRLAEITGLDRKTIHRAYRELTREGVLHAKPGAGTFVSESLAPDPVGPGESGLLRAAHRCLAEAHALGMRPEGFAAFVANVLGDGLRGIPVAVVECNLEQIGLMSDDLARGLGIAPQPLLLQDLRRGASTGSVRAIVTTDCHRNEVGALTQGTDRTVYRVAFDGAFPRAALDALARHPVVMVVRDVGFAPVFRALLGKLGADARALARLYVVEPRDAPRAMAAAGERAVLSVSPLVSSRDLQRLPDGIPRLAARWRVPAAAIERLRVAMGCDLATRPPA